MRAWVIAAAVALGGAAPASDAPGVGPPAKPSASQAALSAGTESGFGLFQQHCMGCHGNPEVSRAPSPQTIRAMAPERIYEALTSGVMQGQGASLTDDQRRMIATFMGGRPLGSLQDGGAEQMPNRCASNPPIVGDESRPAWTGWGLDASNTRFQPAKAAGLTPTSVKRLKLKWAFGYPGGLSAYGQPTVFAGRVFVGADIGYVYALDAKTGCVHWSYKTKAAVRTAISVGRVTGPGGTRWGLFFGDFRADVYGLDAQTGRELWTTKVDDHLVARITAAPTYYRGRLYVPVSSSEEFNAAVLDYPCCTSRGSVVSLDASSGRRIWKSWVVDEPKPTRKNSKGIQQYAPAGGSVWNSPTVDPVRRAVYFGTGDGETEPAAPTTDAVMAVDMDTGKRLWVRQLRAGDAFLGGCFGDKKTDNCPSTEGPDLDIGNSPILQSLPGNGRVLVVAMKDGEAVGLDPDRAGAVRWRVRAVPETPGATPMSVGGVFWGGASDGRKVYYGLNAGGMVALRLKDGAKAWFTPFTSKSGSLTSRAATSAIPGVAFNGDGEGTLRALSAADGRVLWSFDTARPFDTVNHVAAKGGAFGSAGPTIAGGMLFVGSGYGVTGDRFGNVLLAFAPD
jgi:polyvinyl alcohol dehydrogenase (cytochrome)